LRKALEKDEEYQKVLKNRKKKLSLKYQKPPVREYWNSDV